MNKMWGNELQGLGCSQGNSRGLLALITYSRMPLQRKSGVMEFRGTLIKWRGFQGGGMSRVAVFCLVWPQFLSMALNISFDIFWPYFHSGHPYFLIWQASSLVLKLLVPTLWMPAVASPCRSCRRRYYLNGSGAHTVLTDSRTSPVWGSSTDGPGALNVTFNWIPVIEILPVRTRRTWTTPTVRNLVVNSDVSDILILSTAEGGQIARQEWLCCTTGVTIITFVITSGPVWKQQGETSL